MSDRGSGHQLAVSFDADDSDSSPSSSPDNTRQVGSSKRPLHFGGSVYQEYSSPDAYVHSQGLTDLDMSNYDYLENKADEADGMELPENNNSNNNNSSSSNNNLYDAKHKTPTLGQYAEQIQARARSIAFNQPGVSGGSAGGGGPGVRGADDNEGSTKSDEMDNDDDESDVAICEAGQEQTGRWTRDEHDLFLKALKKYGKEWKKIASMVRTRTVIQTRTHAQKFFQKLTKSSMSSMVNIDTFDLSTWNGLDNPEMEGGGGSSSKKPRRADSNNSTSSSASKEAPSRQPSSGKGVGLHTPNMKGAQFILGDPNLQISGLVGLPETSMGQMGQMSTHMDGAGGGGFQKASSLRNSSSSKKSMNLKIIDPDRMPSVNLFSDDVPPQTPWEADIKHLKRSDHQFGLPSNSLVGENNGSYKSLSIKIYALLACGNTYGLEHYLRELAINDSKDISRSVDSVANVLNTYHTNGNTLLMEVCLFNNLAEAVKLSLCVTLVENGAIPSLTDLKGNSCLHICAEKGLENIAKFLLSKGASSNSRNEIGDTPLHIAVSMGHTSIIAVLIASGVNCHVRNGKCKGVLELANEASALTSVEERNRLRKFILTHEPRLRTLIVYHEDFLQHSGGKKGSNSWESPDRLLGIVESVKSLDGNEVAITSDFNKASVEVLSNVHSLEYLNFVDTLSKKLIESANLSNDADFSPASVPFTPQVQKFIYDKSDEELKRPENSDTNFSTQTLRASRRAVGAVVHAVDKVLNGANRNAFCVVRPPGHHAGYQGLLAEATSCGFCIFNSVAAGAVHALKMHKCERVAIIDLDIHHGNGTEDIVRRYSNHSRLFFFSLHLYDNDDEKQRQQQQHPGYQYHFFPGSGSNDDLLHNIVNVPIMPLWLDTNRTTPSASQEISPSSSSSSATAISSSSSAAATSTKKNGAPEKRQTSGRLAYRQVVQQRLIPALRAFNPSLVIVSMGFDAALGDIGNKKRTAPGQFETGMDLLPEDFEWATSEICKVAEVCCDGKIVSVLEGGYGSHEAGNKKSAGGGASSVPNPKLPTGEESAETSINRSLLTTSALAHIKRLINPFE